MSYITELPDDGAIREGLQYAYDFWAPRNKFIEDIRIMLAGNNKIEAPLNTSYKIKTLHTYALASIVNEKSARFSHLPVIQVIPRSEELDSREESSQLELAINVAVQEMERRSDGDVWSRAVVDAICLDEGVERIERAPAAFWPEVVTIIDGKATLPFEDELSMAAIKQYKKQYGIPLRSIYVPLENSYPIYEGPTCVEHYEVEVRTIRDVVRNPLFSNAKDILQNASIRTKEGLRSKITIIHYTNAKWHAYYALTPSTTFEDTSTSFPLLTQAGLLTVGSPVLLHAYEHNLGEVPYNFIPGRFGGWKTSTNRIEGIGKGLLELNSASDEVTSQVFTNIRAKYWPTLLQSVDPEMRGYQPGSSTPKKLVAPEGQDLVIYKGESIKPLFEPVDDPMIPWFMDKINDQMGKLAGSPVLFGQRQPGVETGYQQNLQITQAEHLDEKIEQHLSIAAVRRVTLMLKHVKAMGNLGEVYVHTTEMVGDKKYGKYYSIDPKNLSPMPIMDAQIRPPRPVDFMASIRAAREATDDRGGKGPLMSDDTVRQDILNIQAPDIEQHKILVETEKGKLIASGVIGQKIIEALNLKLVAQNIPDPNAISDAAPMAVEAATRLQGQGTPGVPTAPEAPSTVPLQTGMPTGQSQPEQIVGNQITAAIGMR